MVSRYSAIDTIWPSSKKNVLYTWDDQQIEIVLYLNLHNSFDEMP